MPIDKGTIEYVVELCRIELNPEEIEKFPLQLQSIIDFIDKLKKLNTKDTPPTSHILGLANVLREDLPAECISAEKALRNAPRKDGNFFRVPKVIE